MIEDFINYLIALGYSKKSADSITIALSYFLQWIKENNAEIQTIHYNDVTAYIQDTQKRNITKTTQYKYVDAVKKYLTYLVQAGEITHNPIQAFKLKNVKKKTLHQTLTPEELQNLYKQYKTEVKKHLIAPPQYINVLSRKRNKVMIGLLIYQGLRTSDISSLELKHIQLREGKIQIPSAKRKEERTLSLEPHQIFELSDYINDTRKALLKATNSKSQKLFISSVGSENLHNVFYKLAAELKTMQPKLNTLAQLRASVISQWLKHYNKRKVQNMSGHRYVSSTEHYEQLNVEDLKAEVEKYYPIN